MYHDKKCLALIPARGGSKGIPGKNTYPLREKPLIAYTIEAAISCPYIDDVIVSTDSQEIADVARKCNAAVPFLRPKELAEDTSKTVDCVLHALSQLENSYDVLVLLQPTSPLRTSEDITGAIEEYGKSQKDLVSVSEVREHPILFRRLEDGVTKPLLQEDSTIRRQDMEPFYKVNGAIYINAIAGLSKETSFNDNPAYYIMEQSHSVDVDTYADLALCEFYLSK